MAALVPLARLIQLGARAGKWRAARGLGRGKSDPANVRRGRGKVKAKTNVPKEVVDPHKSETARHLRSLKGNHRVRVGVFNDGQEYPDGTNVAANAVWQEFGTIRRKHPSNSPESRTVDPTDTSSGEQHIPERPAHRLGIQAGRSRFAVHNRAAAMRIFRGKSTIGKELGLLGIIAVDELQTSYEELKDPENRPSTVRQKGSSNPLIDEGILKNANAYEVIDVRKADPKAGEGSSNA